MPTPTRPALLFTSLLALAVAFTIVPARAAPQHVPSAPATGTTVFIPMVTMPVALSPFGFDLRSNTADDILPYVRDAKPKWVRAGDVSWAQIEPVRGGGYRWGRLAQVEENIRRIRQMGVEPLVVVQQSPSWAQRVPGRLCSPPKAENIADFKRFMEALAGRYASGPLKVIFWEIWNEPDVFPSQVSDSEGFGCWADSGLPFYGGSYYGQVVREVYPAIKKASPQSTVLAGALLYNWPDDTVSQGFLRGMLQSGAAGSFDALSFHAYGEWGAGDLLVAKTARIRHVLAEYGWPQKPLFATEIAAMCYSNTSCPTNFRMKQANYAARIYAEAIALGLQGALWFTLTIDGPGFHYSHLIDEVDGSYVPRRSYYAFLNSARLLAGARYVGPPVHEPPPAQIHNVQVLTFRKVRSTLYVMWVPQTDFPKIYNLLVPPGTQAICTDHLSDATPTVYPCSDDDRDGMIPRAVNELPQYVEIFT